MVDHQFDKLTNPIIPEQIQKTDADIATIDALNKYAENNHTIVVLSGGYATEALCGGKITRPHGDMDIHMPVSESQDVVEVFLEIEKIINVEQTKWSLRKQTDKKVEFEENDNNKDFFNKRRLELTVHKEEEKPLFVSSFLVNSKGEKIKVMVVNINELLASKIHKIYSIEKDGVDTTKERHTDDRDFYDLKRLLNLQDFDRQKTQEVLSERYIQKDIGANTLEVAQHELEYVIDLCK